MSSEMKPRRLRKLIERDGLNCAICKNPLTEKTMSIDHIIPLSLGGTHALENLRLAHRRCNGKRGSKPVETPSGSEAGR